MDKKLFSELIKSANQMADHAAGKKVKGVREVVREVATPKRMSEPKIVTLRKRHKNY